MNSAIPQTSIPISSSQTINMRVLWAPLCLLLLSLPSLLPSVGAIEEAVETIDLPFSFLQNLQGCHKGETVEGISQLKEYMKKFGYLIFDDPSNDEFDDHLEEAIKAYQRNFHLSVTGTLDAPTVAMMITPRCGMPDIVDGTRDMLLHPTGHWVKHLGIRGHVHYSFFPGSPRWPPSKYHLTYKFVNNFLDPVIKNVAVSAFSKWASVSNFTFQLVPTTSAADLTVGGFSGNHGDGYSFDGPGGVLAHAFAPTNGRFHLDSQENWSTNPNSQQIDLESVFIHEVGHLLGLGHSQVAQAIMFPSISYGVQKRTLQPDDIAGIQALYP